MSCDSLCWTGSSCTRRWFRVRFNVQRWERLHAFVWPLNCQGATTRRQARKQNEELKVRIYNKSYHPQVPENVCPCSTVHGKPPFAGSHCTCSYSPSQCRNLLKDSWDNGQIRVTVDILSFSIAWWDRCWEDCKKANWDPPESLWHKCMYMMDSKRKLW